MCRAKSVVTSTLFKLLLQGHYITNPNHALFLRANHSNYYYICMGEPASTDPDLLSQFVFCLKSPVYDSSLPPVVPDFQPLRVFRNLDRSRRVHSPNKNNNAFLEGFLFKASKHIKSTPSIYSEVGSEVGIHPKEMKLSLKHCNSFDLGCPSGCHIGTPSILSSGRRAVWISFGGVGLWELDANCPKCRPKFPMKRESTSHPTAADRIMEIIGKRQIFGAPTCCDRAFGNLHISLVTIQR